VSDFVPLGQRFSALPRSVHWLLYAVAAVVLFLVWDTAIGSLTNDLNAKSDRIEAQVRAVRESKHDQRLRDVHRRNVIIGFGPVEAPATPNESNEALTQVIVEVIEAHGVTKEDSDVGGGGTLPKPVSASILKHSQFKERRLKTVTGSLEFETTPDKAIAVIRDFEQRPEIEAVTKVQMKQSSNGRVHVNLELEAWAIGPK
jgi:hypothetical protein